MLVEIVHVVKDQDGEVSRIAKDTADLEAVGRGGMQCGGRTQVIETSQVERTVWLKLIDAFGHRDPLPDQYVSWWKEGSGGARKAKWMNRLTKIV